MLLPGSFFLRNATRAGCLRSQDWQGALQFSNAANLLNEDLSAGYSSLY